MAITTGQPTTFEEFDALRGIDTPRLLEAIAQKEGV